jgi:excisionase family DNA binding protein
MNTHVEERLAYGVKEAARKIGISTSKLWGMIADDQIPCIRLGGRTLIRRTDIDTLLAASVAGGVK